MHRESGKQLSHTAIYLLARGVPGLLTFLAIPLFTRLLSPAEYGYYALVLTSVTLFNGLLFQWLRLSLIRYLPGHRDDPRQLKSTLASVTLLLVGVLGIAALVLMAVPAWGMAVFPETANWRAVVLVCWLLIAVQAGFELSTEYCRALMRPWRYMTAQLMRALCGVALGAVLILTGWTWVGPLAGLAVGMGVAVVWIGLGDWRDIRLHIEPRLFAQLCRYGIPISITVALTTVITAVDRFLLKAYSGADAVGLYSAAFDFTTQSLVLLMMAVNMAVFPLAVHAWEHDGREAAQQQMRYNAALLLAVGAPCVVGLTVLGPGIARCFFDESYRAAAVQVIPLVALGALFFCFKAFHFDAAFQFTHRTIMQVWIAVAVVAINIGLNLWLIPAWGILGAAIASVASFGASNALTVWLGRREVVLPFPWRQAFEVLIACLLMGALLLPLRQWVHPAALAGQICGGAGLYAAALIGLNFLGLRDGLRRKWARLRAPQLSAPLTSLMERGPNA